MDIQKKESAPMVSQVTITLTPEDYREKFQQELTKYGKKVQLKGFRKGKTPMGMVKKLYGRSILAELINNEVQHAMGHYLEDEGVEILGQPIPSVEQKTFEFDPSELDVFEFSFDVANRPVIDLDHVGKAVTFKRYAIEVTDEDVDKELQYVRNSMGQNIEPEDGVGEDDIVYFDAKEYGEAGLVEGGVETKFSVMVKLINDEVKKEVMGAKPGATVNFDIFELEKDRDEASVRKYFLNLQDDDDREVGRIFEATLEQISRRVPAEMNEEFFKQAFGEAAANEEEAREYIRKMISERLGQDGDALLFRDFQEYLIKKTKVDLPNDFLKRLLHLQNENVAAEDIEKDYDAFAENFRWQLIEEQLAKHDNLEVTSEEVVNHLQQRVSGYFSQYGYMGDMGDMVNQTVMRLLQDQEQVRRASAEIMTDKVMLSLKDRFEVEDEEVSRDKFKELVEKTPEERQPANF